jgi:hypothetical protein
VEVDTRVFFLPFHILVIVNFFLRLTLVRTHKKVFYWQFVAIFRHFECTLPRRKDVRENIENVFITFRERVKLVLLTEIISRSSCLPSRLPSVLKTHIK